MKIKILAFILTLLFVGNTTVMANTKGQVMVSTSGVRVASVCNMNAISTGFILAQLDASEELDGDMPEPIDSDESVANKPKQTVEGVLYTIGVTILILAILWAFGHMIYIFFFVEKKIPTYSLEEIKMTRKANGMSEDATDEDNAAAIKILNALYDNNTTKFRNANGDEQGLPTKRAHMLEIKSGLDSVAQILPTDAEVVDVYNSTVNVYNDAQTRIFNGSKLLLILAGILAAILIFTVGFQPVPFFAFSIAMYWLSAMKPTFMFYEMELKGKKSGRGFMNAILGGLFGMVATATTYKTITEYSDGSKTEETDNSETWFSLVLALVVSIFLVFFMSVVGLINYLRNYIFFK